MYLSTFDCRWLLDFALRSTDLSYAYSEQIPCMRFLFEQIVFISVTYQCHSVNKQCKTKQQDKLLEVTQTRYYFNNFIILWANFTFFKGILVFLDLNFCFEVILFLHTHTQKIIQTLENKLVRTENFQPCFLSDLIFTKSQWEYHFLILQMYKWNFIWSISPRCAFSKNTHASDISTLDHDSLSTVLGISVQRHSG